MQTLLAEEWRDVCKGETGAESISFVQGTFKVETFLSRINTNAIYLSL